MSEHINGRIPADANHGTHELEFAEAKQNLAETKTIEEKVEADMAANTEKRLAELEQLNARIKD